MKNIFTTFCATSLLWSLALLYGFAGGHIERHAPDYLEALQPVKAVHLANK